MFKIEFSKLLTIVVSLLYIYVVVFYSGMYFLEKSVPLELLNNIQTPFMTIITGYFIKAGIENVNKINKAGDENNDK